MGRALAMATRFRTRVLQRWHVPSPDATAQTCVGSLLRMRFREVLEEKD